MSNNLMDTFEKAVQLFNNFHPKNWPELEPLLHDDIRMKRIEDKPPNSYYKGKSDVKGFLFGKGATVEFKLDGPPHYHEIGKYGFVSGFAILSKNSTKRRIAYSFAYKRGDDPSNPDNWQEIHSWGKPI